MWASLVRANRIGSLLVRPHDVAARGTCRRSNTEEAMIDRIVHLGFEDRIEMTPATAIR